MQCVAIGRLPHQAQRSRGDQTALPRARLLPCRRHVGPIPHVSPEDKLRKHSQVGQHIKRKLFLDRASRQRCVGDSLACAGAWPYRAEQQTHHYAGVTPALCPSFFAPHNDTDETVITRRMVWRGTSFICSNWTLVLSDAAKDLFLVAN